MTTPSSVDVGKHSTDDDAGTASRPSASGEPVLSVRGLGKHFPIRSSGLIRRKVGDVHAVCDVSFDIYERETMCIVGESGCGKTTTGRLVLNLLPASQRRGDLARAAISPSCRRGRCGRCDATCRSCSRIRSPRSIRG